MKRRILLTTVAVMLLLCFATTGALAATQAEMRLLERKVDTANLQIKVYVLVAMLTPYDDVDWLLSMVDATVGPVFAYAASIGATVVCEYDYYWIDGRIVAVDPLKVINVGTGD
ncbi:MAG: hypothetical protein ACOYI5_05980 [Christensenellales bacterium]|jgi:uncharacterized membrane protein